MKSATFFLIVLCMLSVGCEYNQQPNQGENIGPPTSTAPGSPSTPSDVYDGTETRPNSSSNN